MIRAAALLALTCTAAFAQVEAPTLGYLPDGARVRPVYGIPAAAGVGPALNFGRDFALVAVSPRQDFAIASAADSGAILLAFPGGNTAPLAGVSPGPDRMVLSPSGSAAAVWFASSGRVEIIGGLPSAPSVRNLDTGFPRASLTDIPASLAVSDDGQWLAGTWPDGVYAFGPYGELRKLPVRERGAVLAFFAGRQDLAVATRSGVFSFTDVGGAARESTLYEEASLHPAGLALSADNQRLVMAQDSGSLLALDLMAGSSAKYDCACSPDGVAGMGQGLFRITAFNGATFKLFDAATGDVFFVPLMADGGGRQ